MEQGIGPLGKVMLVESIMVQVDKHHHAASGQSKAKSINILYISPWPRHMEELSRGCRAAGAGGMTAAAIAPPPTSARSGSNPMCSIKSTPAVVTVNRLQIAPLFKKTVKR